MTTSITAAIISRTEHISSLTLRSVQFCDEIIVVVDTKEIKKPTRTGRINYFYRALDADFSAQRNYAISKASSEWILFVDSDEHVGTELALEIQEAIKHKRINGYFLPRIDVVFHDELKHGETGKTKLLRLARKDSGQFARSVHEKWLVTGATGELKSPLYHAKDRFVSEFINRIGEYGPVDAEELNSEHKPFSLFRLFAFPKAKFILNYIFRLGILDGTPGFFLAYLLAVQSLSVRIFQWTKIK